MRESKGHLLKTEKIKQGFRDLWKQTLDILYPRRCPICETILTDGRKICPECRKKLPFVKEPLCKKCGKPLERETQEYCGDCQKGQHEFVCGRSVFIYERALRRSINRMKFSNRREYLDFYAEAMAEWGKPYLKRWKPAVILPVPVNRRKKRERGFDQSLLLARKLSALTGVPVEENSLIRVRYTMPQKDLDARQRQKNLQGAFRLKEGFLPKEPVLLVDDIYTTGATIDEICRVLHKAGIHELYFLNLSTGKGKQTV